MYNPSKPFKKHIFELIQQTWETPYVLVQKSQCDVYPIIKRKFSFPEIDHTDGIGTKGLYHWQKRYFRNATLDALAMNLNDLTLSKAIPFKLQDHLILPEDDNDAIIETISTLSDECVKRQIAITGGETSIQNTMQGIDLSLTVSGFIKNYKPNIFLQGDILIGLKSSGLHSNGFTKVREIFKNEYRDEFIEPTKIYVDLISSLEELIDIRGMRHITGGAFTKLKDVILNENCDIIINKPYRLQPHNIFYELYEKGISDEDMYKTFNCGIGFIIAVSPEDVNKIQLEESEIIGEIRRGEGEGKVIIESSFSDRIVVF